MDFHQEKIIEAAQKLGIEVEVLIDKWHIDLLRLSYEGRTETVLKGRVFSHLSHTADQIGANKVASKGLMKELGIPVPESILFAEIDFPQEAITEFFETFSPAVLKPLDGTDGMGIAMHLTSLAEVIQHLKHFAGKYDQWILEEQVAGEDLRLQYLAGKMIAACIRRPCTLTGDGEQTIFELIESRNAFIYQQNPANRIVADHQVRRRLSEAGLSLSSILPAGERLQIKDVSNMSQGGHAIDLTEQVHPKYQSYLDKLAESLNLRLFSLDVMTPDPEADPDENAHILELNAQPAWLHHTFSEGKSHDIPTLILKDLFGID